MAKLQHKNLLHFGNSSEVYASLQEDYNRDTLLQSLWQMVLFGCAVGAAVFSNHADWLWLFGGLYAIERAIARFVDNSNRNWAMHMIDWIEADRASQKNEQP